MADVNLVAGKDGKLILIENINARRPFAKGSVQVCEELVVGTDFTSGDNLQIDLPYCTKIMSADAKQGSSGTFTAKSFVESDLSSGNAGKRITIANCTGNIKLDIKGAVD